MSDKIDLSYTINDKNAVVLNSKNLLDEVAKAWADKIAEFKCGDKFKKTKKTKKTQVRNFYDKVLELEQSIKKDGFESVYPFIKMLNSKVAYGVTRDVVNCKFQEMFNICLEQIKLDNKGEQTFKNFKLFFEAVIGFYKGERLR